MGRGDIAGLPGQPGNNGKLSYRRRLSRVGTLAHSHLHGEMRLLDGLELMAVDGERGQAHGHEAVAAFMGHDDALGLPRDFDDYGT
jgi:hypothetical protein